MCACRRSLVKWKINLIIFLKEVVRRCESRAARENLAILIQFDVSRRWEMSWEDEEVFASQEQNIIHLAVINRNELKNK